MNLQTIQTITLDFTVPQLKNIRCVENDLNSRTVKISVTNNGSPFPLNRETMTACYKIHKPDHNYIYNEVPIDENGTVTIHLTDQAMAKAGIARCELQILTKDKHTVLSTMPFSVIVEKSVVTDKDIVSSSESDVLLGMMQHMADYNNPHQTTKEHVGLGNADNTSDLDKPVSNAARRELDKLNSELDKKADKSSLHKAAVSGSYDDLSDKPQIPFFGVCDTAQGAAAKTVSCPDFTLNDGARILVLFHQGNSSNYMTLNINNTGAYFAWFQIGLSRAYNDKAISELIAPGCLYEFTYQSGSTPKWVYCGIISTAETIGAVKKTGDAMTGDLTVPAINNFRLLRCGASNTSIESVINYAKDWQHTVLFTAGWENPFVPDKNTIFGFGGLDVLTAVSYSGKIYHTESDGDKRRWVQVGLNKAEIEAACLPRSGGCITGNLILPTQNTMIYGEDTAGKNRNHALMIGHNSQDFWNFYEFGGVFNFYKSQDNHDTLLGRITENGWEGDASRSDALQSFQSNKTPYPRGEYVIRSIYGEDQKFWLQCLNDNSDPNKYQVAVDWADNAHCSDHSQYLKTFNASGQIHGDDWLLKCQHNLFGDGTFGLRCGNGSIGIKVDFANKDGCGRVFEDNYARAIRKFYDFHTVGWHRIAKFEYQENLHVALGNMANGCEITIKRAYNLTNNQYHHLELAVVYRKSKWKEIVSLANTLAITKIRHVYSGATAYIDVYYNTTIRNNTTITITGPVGSDYMANWQFLDDAPIVSESDYTAKFSELTLSKDA